MAQPRKGRGFAALSPDAQRKLARAGGLASHQSGHAHEWTSEEARAAGRLGGLAAHHHERAAFHHETAAHHHQRAASHHAAGNRSRAKLHAESAYEHEQRAGEHAEQAFRSSGAGDQDERDDSQHENLDRVGHGEDLPLRQEEPDYSLNNRSESTGTARENG